MIDERIQYGIDNFQEDHFFMVLYGIDDINPKTTQSSPQLQHTSDK